MWWGCDAPADSRPLIGRLPISGFDTRFASGSSLRGPPVALREPAPLVGGHLPPGARAAVRGSGSGSGAAAASWAGALRGLHAKRVKPVWALPRSAPLLFFFFFSVLRGAQRHRCTARARGYPVRLLRVRANGWVGVRKGREGAGRSERRGRSVTLLPCDPTDA